jgi:hypothetical protein
MSEPGTVEIDPLAPPAELVACETCAYFRPLTADERKALPADVTIDGDGFCYANPPAPSIVQGEHKLSHKPVGILGAMRCPVKLGDICRHWRGNLTFAGDVSNPVAEALERCADYLRESVKVGEGSIKGA